MGTRLTISCQRRIGFLLAGNLILLVIIFALLKPGASFAQVVLRAGPDVAPALLAGLGLTGIIYTGAIDLSIASIIAVAGTVFGICVHHGLSPSMAFASCFATAALLSLFNGWLVRLLKVSAIIVTLAGLVFYRGTALILADLLIPKFGGNISVHAEAYHLPGKEYAGTVLLIVVLGAILWEAFAKTPREWLALGSSEEACRFMGLNPDRIRTNAFGIGGLFLGLAALIYATRIQAIEPSRIALGFELPVIGAVVLGGTNIFGGEGSFIGTVLGAFFLYFVSQVLVYAGASPYVQDAIAGGILIAVIGLDCALHRREKLMEELA